MIVLQADELKNPEKRRLAGILRDGGIGVWKTDTIYGYFGRYDRQETVERISLLKGRSASHYFSLAFEQIQPYFEWFDLTAAQMNLLVDALPGAFTFVLPLKKDIVQLKNMYSDFLGVRVPAHELTRDLCKYAEAPLITTSANISGFSDSLKIGDIPGYKEGQLDFIVDSGKIDSPTASSVIKLFRDRYLFLRVGAISEEEFKVIWNKNREEL